MTPPGRAEYLAHALVFGALVGLTGLYFPTSPTTVTGVRVCLLPALAWFVVGLVRARPPVGASWLGHLARVLCWIPASGALVGLALVAGAALMLLVPPRAAIALTLTLPATWLLAHSLHRRARIPGAASRLYITGSGALYCLLWPLVLHVAWSPPSTARCREVAEHEHVERLTGQRRVDELSYPYDLHWMPERRILVATMKMAGNGVLPYWNEPTANELVLVELADPAAPRVRTIERHGDRMPEYVTTDAAGERLAVSYLGYGANRLELLDIGDLDAIRSTARIEVERSMNRLVTLPPVGARADGGGKGASGARPDDGGASPPGWERLAVFMPRRPALQLRRWTDLAFLRRVLLRSHDELLAGRVMDATGDGSGRRLYASVLNGPVVELELLEPDGSGDEEVRQRTADVDPGIGTIAADGASGLVVRGNLFGSDLDVLSTDPLEQRGEVPVPYRTRPLLLDGGRRVLLAGEWLDGTVHVLSYDGWDAAAPPLPTGPYLRDMALDGDRGQLFVGSKCGLYRIDLDAHLADHGEGHASGGEPSPRPSAPWHHARRASGAAPAPVPSPGPGGEPRGAHRSEPARATGSKPGRDTS